MNTTREKLLAVVKLNELCQKMAFVIGNGTGESSLCTSVGSHNLPDDKMLILKLNNAESNYKTRRDAF